MPRRKRRAPPELEKVIAKIDALERRIPQHNQLRALHGLLPDYSWIDTVNGLRFLVAHLDEKSIQTRAENAALSGVKR